MPRSSGSAPPHRHTAGPLRTREELTALRPDLVARYDAELGGARAAVLGRLLGALDREPLPGLLNRAPGTATFGVDRSDGVTSAATTRTGETATVRYPAHAAKPFARVEAGLTVTYGPQRSIVDPGELVRALWGDTGLAVEIDNSVANLALARADPPDQRMPQAGDPDALGRIEQQVTDGHPLHPCCRTRGGMTVADVLAYAPEHSPVIRLHRLRVPRPRWYGTAPPILYAHPWQAARLLTRHPWLTPDGETDPVRPLMSLRTVAPVNGGPHIKTAVDVQMTSAVRTVSPAAVHNGPVLSKLLRRLTADQPIDILAEIAAGAVLVDGVPQRHLAHVIREAPQLHDGELAIPLAAIRTVDDPYGWMTALAEIFFAPITCVLARGVALEAHGQNTLVVIKDGRPQRILYRDLGGVRVSARRLRNSGIEPPALHGDLPSDDPAELRTKLAAAAFGTVAAELIATFTRTHGADPDRLWGIVARAVRATGTEDVPYLLKEPLPIKATTAMRLATDPLDDQWALIDNPMTGHA
nr:IucA/IucC family protein [Actinoplanes ovalisporus]